MKRWQDMGEQFLESKTLSLKFNVEDRLQIAFEFFKANLVWNYQFS